LNEKMALGSFRSFQFGLAKWGWAGAALVFDVFPNGFEVEQPMPRMGFGRLQKTLEHCDPIPAPPEVFGVFCVALEAHPA
jgi:hypothetical protein